MRCLSKIREQVDRLSWMTSINISRAWSCITNFNLQGRFQAEEQHYLIGFIGEDHRPIKQTYDRPLFLFLLSCCFGIVLHSFMLNFL